MPRSTFFIMVPKSKAGPTPVIVFPKLGLMLCSLSSYPGLGMWGRGVKLSDMVEEMSYFLHYMALGNPHLMS